MCDHIIMIIWVVKVFLVQFFCVFLPPLLISSASVRSIPFLSFIEPIFARNVPLVSLIFFKRYLVFLMSLLFFGTLHSDVYIFPFLLCFLLLFFSQLFVRPLQTDILLLCISFPRGWS